jgi:Ricin-type beta-trefoil lectin domain
LSRLMRRAAAGALAIALLMAGAAPATASPDYHLIHSRLSNKCLTVYDSNTADGAKVVTWTCVGYANQQWYWDGEELRSKLNDKCLYSTNTADGSEVRMWTCVNYADRTWY